MAKVTGYTDFYTDYYSNLTGATIVSFRGMQEDEYGSKPFPVFLVRFADGQVGEVAISSDEEGNGGGFIFGVLAPR